MVSLLLRSLVGCSLLVGLSPRATLRRDERVWTENGPIKLQVRQAWCACPDGHKSQTSNPKIKTTVFVITVTVSVTVDRSFNANAVCFRRNSTFGMCCPLPIRLQSTAIPILIQTSLFTKYKKAFRKLQKFAEMYGKPRNQQQNDQVVTKKNCCLRSFLPMESEVGEFFLPLDELNDGL